MRDNTIEAFFALVRAGLWETEAQLASYGEVDHESILRVAQEQSVVGLVAAGMEHVEDVKIPRAYALQFAGETIQLESRNKAMNQFVAGLVAKMRKAGIYTLLVKGQGIAQCYERPFWRACGDVDFFLSNDNYQKAKEYLVPLASSVESEGVYGKHLGMVVNGWIVELHGSLRCGLSKMVDKELEEVLIDTFKNGNVASWNDDGVQVFMLGAENDAFYVFNHFLGHFYKGGIGLRQVCDWCRLLWKHRDTLDQRKLESRIQKVGLLSEWKAFGVFAVEYLGMPIEAMPFLSDNDYLGYKIKAEKICRFVMEVGNFGKNRDMSFYHNGSYFVQKVKSFGRRCGDMIRHISIFPVDTVRFFPCILINGLKSALRGE